MINSLFVTVASEVRVQTNRTNGTGEGVRGVVFCGVQPVDDNTSILRTTGNIFTERVDTDLVDGSGV